MTSTTNTGEQPSVLVVWPIRPNAMNQLEQEFRLVHLSSSPDPRP
ncbi:MAG: hypothetical protein R3D25_08845 [Geminicoccaceae bacterium]